MSEINKMDAVMLFVDFPFLKNDSLKLNIVEKTIVHRKHPDYETSFSKAVTDPKSTTRLVREIDHNHHEEV